MGNDEAARVFEEVHRQMEQWHSRLKFGREFVGILQLWDVGFF